MPGSTQEKTTGDVLRELGKRLFSRKSLAMHGACAAATMLFLGTCFGLRGQTLQDDIGQTAYKIGEIGLDSDHANSSHAFCKPFKIADAGGPALAGIYRDAAERLSGLRHTEPGEIVSVSSIRNVWEQLFSGQSADKWQEINITRVSIARTFIAGFASDCPDDLKTNDGLYKELVNGKPALVINVPSHGTSGERAAAIADQIAAVSMKMAHL